MGINGEVVQAEGFRFNHNDSWSFTHDKEAHALGGAYVESALHNQFGGHLPSIVGAIIAGGLWEVKDSYIHNILGDKAGFSKQDWGYVAIGAFSSVAIELTVSQLLRWLW